MGVQKHLFVIERNAIKELLKLKTNARSFTKYFFINNNNNNNNMIRFNTPTEGVQ